MENFDWIKKNYHVPAEIGREILYMGKRKGVIAKSMRGYIGVNFHDRKPGIIEPLHPTWNIEYLESFAKVRPMTRSQKRYQAFLEADPDCCFKDWITKKHYDPFHNY